MTTGVMLVPSKISKSDFEARALEIFRHVETSGERVIISVHGKPTLEIRPYRNDARNPLDVLRGSVIRYGEPVREASEAAVSSAGS